MTESERLTKKIKRKLKDFQNASNDKINDQHEKVVFQVRANYLQRWCEICGTDNPAEIDYNEPHVFIEHLLCDPVNMHKLRNAKTRQEVYDLMPPEVLDVYLHEVDEHGARYCDLEHKSMVGSVVHGRKTKKQSNID